MISCSTMRSLLPDLSDDDLTVGARWYGAQVLNSERLVLSVTLSAKERGAHVLRWPLKLEFVLDHELTYTLSDLVLRRTDIGSFALPAQETIEFCADRLAERWGGTAIRVAQTSSPYTNTIRPGRSPISSARVLRY